jgi:neutral ceramidase
LIRPAALLRRGLVALAALTGGCHSVSGTLPEPQRPEPPLVFRAGAARVDLTPPPGYPMGGFSSIGQVARGHWTRLHARAVHLQDARGRAIAMVSCELWSISAGLADRVAERLGDDPVTAHIGREQLVLAATHTHHSPGNYSSSLAYNAFASPKAGFDRDLFEHYAERIHHAIATACRRSSAARLRFASVKVPGLARNRSLDAFRANPEHAGLMAGNAHLPRGPASDAYPDPDCYHAIDASVSVLRVDRAFGDHGPIAVLGFAALHPTVLGPEAPVYNSDVFGVAALQLERESGRAPDGEGPRAVVALFNGAEGDVSAAWTEQGRPETVRLGRILASGVRAAWDEAGTRPWEEVAIDHRFAVVPMSGQEFVCGGETVRTATTPAIGLPALGGAEDGRTPDHEKGAVEGMTGHSPAGHGDKRAAFSVQVALRHHPFLVKRFVHLVAGPPEEVPLGVYSIGRVRLATVPGEATTMIGHRIRETVGGDPTLVVGLANEYLSYFTTPEEYALQHYEGASSLWGTYAGALLVVELGRLAAAAPGTLPVTLPRSFRYTVGNERRFGLSHVQVSEADPLAGLDTLGIVDGLDRPWIEWEDVRTSLRGSAPHLTPRVAIEAQGEGGAWTDLILDGAPEDDDGHRFVTVVTAVGRTSTTWRAFWTPPPGLPDGAVLRFRVRRCDGTLVHSPPLAVSR